MARWRFIDILTRNDEQDGNLYLLLDTATQKDFWKAWGHQLLKARAQWQYYYHDTEFNHLREASPILVCIEDGNIGNDLLHSLIGNSWGCILSSPFNLNQTLDHCQRWLTVYFPNNQEHLFRWYSPQILRTLFLSDNFDEEDKHRLSHPFLTIYTPEVDNTYLQLFSQRRVIATESQLPQNGWFHLDQELLDEINLLYHQDKLALLAVELFKVAPILCMNLEHEQVIKGLDDGLTIASQYKHASENVRKNFAFNRFLVASHFWLHKEFALAAKLSSLGNAIYQLQQRQDWQMQMAEYHHDSDWLSSLKEVGNE